MISMGGAGDDAGFPQPSSAKVNQNWIITFCDLVALMLTFFVMLYTISARDPSKVDAAVSSVNDKFAISRLYADQGLMAATSGIVLTEQEYLDAVITTIRGRSILGEVKTGMIGNGTLMARIDRDKLFVPRTGVLSPEGQEFAHDIARVLLKKNSGISLRSMEMRLSASADEINAATASMGTEAPVIIRQAGSFVKELTDKRVSARAISALITPGEKAELVLLFYSAAPPGGDTAE